MEINKYKFIQIGSKGKIGDIINNLFNTNATDYKKVSIRKNQEIDKIIKLVLKCDIIFLCQKMRDIDNLKLLDYLIKQLLKNNYKGKVVNFGSTTEFYPLPFKIEYGNIKKKSLEIICNRNERKYNIIHIICPGSNIINKKKLKNLIINGINSEQDFFDSCALEIQMQGNNSEDYIYSTKKIVPLIHLIYIIRFTISIKSLLLFYRISKSAKNILKKDTSNIIYKFIINNKNIKKMVIYLIVGKFLEKTTKLSLKTSYPNTRKSMFIKPSSSEIEKAKKNFQESGLAKISIRPKDKSYLKNINSKMQKFFSVEPKCNHFNDNILRETIENITGKKVFPLLRQNNRGTWYIHQTKSGKGFIHKDKSYIKQGYVRAIYYHTLENSDYKINFWKNDKVVKYILGTGLLKKNIFNFGEKEKLTIKPLENDLILINKGTVHQANGMTTGKRLIQISDFSYNSDVDINLNIYIVV